MNLLNMNEAKFATWQNGQLIMSYSTSDRIEQGKCVAKSDKFGLYTVKTWGGNGFGHDSRHFIVEYSTGKVYDGSNWPFGTLKNILKQSGK